MKLGPITNGGTYGPWEMIDEGWYDAVCVDIIEDGLIQTKLGLSPAMTLVFQLDERQKNNKRYLIFHRLWLKDQNGSVTLSGGAIKQLVAWRGARKVEEMQDTNELLGQQAKVKVAHRRYKEKTYANIIAIDPPENTIVAEPYVRPERRFKSDETSQEGENGTPF